MYVCLAVTCHLHFWQNDWDLLCATTVTRGWNRYWNESAQKIDPRMLLPGFEPRTFWSQIRCCNHWAIPAPSVVLAGILLYTKSVDYCVNIHSQVLTTVSTLTSVDHCVNTQKCWPLSTLTSTHCQCHAPCPGKQWNALVRSVRETDSVHFIFLRSTFTFRTCFFLYRL